MVDQKISSDHGEYLGMLRRMLRALGRRIGNSDPYDLALMLELREQLDEAIAQAVKAQREAGFSWAEIGEPSGMTKQAAQQRWAKRIG